MKPVLAVLAAIVVVVAGATLVAVSRQRSRDRTPRVLTSVADTPRAVSARVAGTHHYEYVFPDRHIDVYDIDRGHRLVEEISVPDAHSLHGVAVSPVTRTLYLSAGGNGGSSGNGSLLAYDLLRNHFLWRHRFSSGADSPAITPDGRTIFLPMGERTRSLDWYVVDARTGDVTSRIAGGLSPHNTIVSADGRFVYLAPRNGHYLAVASVQSRRVVRRVGPLLKGVRPFTVDGASRVAYMTTTGLLGFQVGSLRTGRVLYTIRIPSALPINPLGAPSHGISLSPDSRELYVIDVPASSLHVYDVSQVPTFPPRHVADIRLTRSMKGKESPCGGDCGRAGWLQHSLDGRYLYVGDSGDVIDTRTRRATAFLPALHNSRYQFELDWRTGFPVRTSTRSGIGRPS